MFTVALISIQDGPAFTSDPSFCNLPTPYLAAMPPRRKKKSKNGAVAAIIVSVVAALAAIAWLLYLWADREDVRMITYKEFGIPMPTSYAIHGIDVSRYQQRISWTAVREMNVDGIRLGFAFIKATEGVRNTDPFFRRNWRKSREAGIVRGAYHFFLPTKSGRAQAANFIATVDLEPGDLPPVLDVEMAAGAKPAAIRKEVQAWLDSIEGHYRVRPVIYANISFYNRYLAGYFDDYPLWIAHYLQPLQPRIQRAWSFWQHSETGHANGIATSVDFNVFNGDSTQFRSLLVGQ
ncbi:MAG: glycoside hydrolase [Flaviaesturariibacter sp.]|nr:glycoside hydrolase [Flaviaesturariibacter sp.]